MAPQEIKLSVRVIVFQEDGFWIGQCLEYDISCQAKTMRELRKRVMESLAANMMIAKELGKPFTSLSQAPKKFFDMFEQSQEEFQHKDMPMREFDINPTLRLADLELCA